MKIYFLYYLLYIICILCISLVFWVFFVYLCPQSSKYVCTIFSMSLASLTSLTHFYVPPFSLVSLGLRIPSDCNPIFHLAKPVLASSSIHQRKCWRQNAALQYNKHCSLVSSSVCCSVYFEVVVYLEVVCSFLWFFLCSPDNVNFPFFYSI